MVKVNCLEQYRADEARVATYITLLVLPAAGCGGALCIKTEMTGLNVVWCVVIRKKGGICFIVQKKSKTEVKNAMHGRKTKIF